MKKQKRLSLEESLTRAMQLISSQIAREMQRSPAERSVHGVEKWKPMQARVERTAELVLNTISSKQADLDSLLVLAEGFSKALSLYIRELEEEGLGSVRSSYCLSALESISRDCFSASNALRKESQLN